MSNCVAELDSLLQSMQELKPPGVSGPKIQSITSLCTANVKDETVLIQKVYAHFKKAPSNKKLGVLYVVDSVSRQWLEHARKSGQTMGSGAAHGTFAAGVNHVTELLPSFMSDIISVAPEEQKVKIKKLVDIWERGNTFPAAMLSGFKQKLEAPATNAGQSTTPVGTPPKDFASAIDSSKPAPDTASILANLQALANLPKPNVSAASAGNPSQGGSTNNVSYPQTTFSQNVPSVNAYSMQPAAQAVNAPTPINGGVISYGLPQNIFSSGQPNQTQAQQPMMPHQNPGAPGADGGLQQQLQILSALKSQGIPEAQWPALLSVLMSNSNGGGNVAAAAAAAIPQQLQMGQNSNAYGGRDDSSRDRNGYDQYIRSPPGRYRDRSRSRSPRRDRYRNDSPPRRGSPVYGEYGERSGDSNRRNGRGGNRGGNRQRSPNQNRRSLSPVLQTIGTGEEERNIEYDPSLGEGMIKVLSRTLFVGGVTCSENDLRAIFAGFGRVQTCIVNLDKRHAFVKMITRKEAERAKVEMEHYKSDSMQLRTRWGVGFGPRPCSDYATGISVIPIDRLTDADRKWMLTAEYGGSGGRPIESGLVVEEPDIEIGAGVSSKAISRRMQTDKSGSMGPRSSRDSGSGSGRNRDKQTDNVNQTPLGGGQGNAAPAVPGFGFPFMQGGMMFGSNFNVPSQNNSQPPPPGAG